ncbi:MAG: thioredoxin family protein [Mariniblastus sp.]
MKPISATIMLLVAIAATANVNAQQPVDYKTAYEQAQKGEKPLLVLITAQWCPPCQIMKKTTIPELMQKKAFKGFHYATVDLDKETTLARQLIGTRGVPQLIMYEKNDGKWVRRYLRGAQTAQTVEAFVAQAIQTRTASATTQNVGK